ncbi:TetR/AcrR family transcriptional regulator [Streptomyces calidiresistens]|uniref:TetR family transcriptional regulator n=1 Tax=Streptomyces calidiresistens TaxID=1485586 RepID=A0A7W3XXE0_9ACTN|nr:TetR/AcrR family transcriptional regulator [Streptomyces calidiresistens]MBB0230707.1 TetR family transcriptional regulator [Streptomyces calidiresistens]
MTARARSRLSAEREGEILRAVLELLREHGYEALTMDLVAARTRSSKATLYRQWESKARLVLVALRRAGGTPGNGGDIDTGSVAGDLRELMRRAGDHVVQNTELLRALALELHRGTELRETFREVILLPEIEVLRTILDRGVARGEITAGGPSAEEITYMLMGAIVGRPLLEEREADAEFLVRCTDTMVLPALGVPPRP